MAKTAFISYSHRDRRLEQELVRHLSPLRLSDRLKIWHDPLLGPGQAFTPEIETQLAAADLVLLLISANFLASPYCAEREMVRAFERATAGKARVVPIIAKPCRGRSCPSPQRDWATSQLPIDGKPVSDFRSRDTAWDQITGALANMLEADAIELPRIRGASADIRVRGRGWEQVTYNAFFALRSDILDASGDGVMEKVIVLARAGGEVNLVGHCDDIEDDLTLSEARARAVAALLVSRGVDGKIKLDWKRNAPPDIRGIHKGPMNRRVQITIEVIY